MTKKEQASYAGQLTEQRQAALTAAKAKVEKLRGHLIGAEQGVAEAVEAFDAAKATDRSEPGAGAGDHVVAEARHAAGYGTI